MILGIGTDIVAVRRIADFLERHGERALEKVLAPEEREECRASADPVRFLAKRWAAKEALGKALGTGVRAPAVLPAMAVAHDALGKPGFVFSAELAPRFAGLSVHLSISDEQEHAVAFVILEKP